MLEARDGTASPRSPRLRTSRRAIGVVVLPDVRGLYRFYEELALRFAERGYPAVAIDYFGRTAGVGEARRRVRVHGARRADDARGDPGRRRRRGRVPALPAAAAARPLHRRLLLRRPQLVARGRGRPRARRRGRLLRPPGRARRRARPDAARREIERAGPRAAGGRRRRTSPPRTTTRSTGARRRRASSTRSSPTTAPRTASSTASTRSSPTRRRTRGTRVLAFLERHAR